MAKSSSTEPTVITAESTYEPPPDMSAVSEGSNPPALDMNSPAAMKAFMDMLGTAIGTGIKSTTRPKMTFGEYVARQNASRHKLTCTAFQNDQQVHASHLTNEEIDLLNKVNRSGRYIDRQVEVIFNDTSGERIVLFRYSNKTADDRFKLRGEVRNFLDLLTQITTAQAQENAEDDAQREAIAEIRRKKRA